MATHRTAGPLQGWIATTACWLAVIGAVLIAPLLPFMQSEFASYPNAQALVTLTLAIPALTIALVSPIAGRIIDATGRKNVFIVALVIYAIAGTAPVWLSNLYAIIGTRVVVGATEACLTTVAAVLTADYFQGRTRERWLAIQAGSASVVAVIMFGLGGYLGSLALGWRTPFLIYGAMILLLPFVIAFIWEPTKIATVADARTRRGVPWRLVGHICAMTVFASICFYVTPVQLSFLLHDRGLADPASIGLASAIANMGVPIGSFIFQAFSRQPIARLLAASLVLFGAGFALMAQSDVANMTVVGGFIACLGGGISLPLLLTWTVSKLPFEQRGSGSGAFTGAFFLGQFCSPVLIAIVSAQLHSLPSSIAFLSAVCGALGVLTIALCLTRAGREGRLSDATPVGSI